VDVAEGLADSTVAARAREHVDAEPHQGRYTAFVAHGNGEAFVVEHRRSVGYGPPAEHPQRGNHGVSERIGQLEEKRLAIRI